MRRLKRWWVVSLLFATFPVLAQTPILETTPSWVIPIDIDFKANSQEDDAGGYYYLLLDGQEHVPQQTSFVHYAYKILTIEGVQNMSTISVDFDPSYQQVSFHYVTIHRKSETLDKLSEKEIRIIQREESMDRHLYDGTMTALINLKDVRQGDVIEYAYSIKGYNPALEGRFSKKIYFDFFIPYEKLFERVLVLAETKLNLKAVNEEVIPIIQPMGDMVEYSWMLERVEPFTAERNVPAWHDPYRHVMITDFNGWRDVADLAVRQFTLPRDEWSKLQERVSVQFEKKASEQQIQEVIRFVQDEIRYLGFESGLNSHQPHSPVQVFDQRFGDCKDKSLLLSSMLKLLGVTAYPILVNTSLHGHVEESLPSIAAFNHCVVQIMYKGKTFYVDPTINNQGGSFRHLYFPRFGKGLLVKEGTSALISLPEQGVTDVTEENTIDMDKVEGGAIFTVKTTYQGIEADRQRAQYAGKSLAAIQKSYLGFYSSFYPNIESIEKIRVQDDREKNIFIVEEKYNIQSFWKSGSELDSKIYCALQPFSLENFIGTIKALQRKSPYKLNFPVSYHHYIHVNLPEDWAINDEQKSIVSPYYAYQYNVTYGERKLTLYRHYQTLNDHIPSSAFAQFAADHKTMKENLSYYLTYDKNLTGPFRVSWFSMAVTSIYFVLAIGLALFLYFRFDPYAQVLATVKQPIGGWLMVGLIAIGIMPLYMLYNLYHSPAYFDNKTWLILWSKKNWGLFTLLLFELAYKVTYVVMAFLLIALFYFRRTSLPKLITLFYGIGFIFIFIDSVFTFGLIENLAYAERLEIYAVLVTSFLSVIIWIPYFTRSARVKETFVQNMDTSKRVSVAIAD